MQGFVRQRLKDDSDSAKETAVQLCLVDDGIVLSSSLAGALNSGCKLTTVLANAPGETLAFEAHWRSEIPSVAFGSESRYRQVRLKRERRQQPLPAPVLRAEINRTHCRQPDSDTRP